MDQWQPYRSAAFSLSHCLGRMADEAAARQEFAMEDECRMMRLWALEESERRRPSSHVPQMRGQTQLWGVALPPWERPGLT